MAYSNSIWYNHIMIHMTQLTGLFCISSQWACCSTFKYLASACCSSCSALQKSSTFPSSTCIDLLQGDFMYITFHICYMCSSSSIKLHAETTCSQKHVSVDVLAVAAKSAKTKNHEKKTMLKLSESCHDRTCFVSQAQNSSAAFF